MFGTSVHDCVQVDIRDRVMKAPESKIGIMLRKKGKFERKRERQKTIRKRKT